MLGIIKRIVSGIREQNRYRSPVLTAADEPGVQHLEAIKYPVIVVPFYGKMVPVIVRRLEHIDALQIGNFSVIPDFHADVVAKNHVDFRRMQEYIEIHNAILKAVMVRPTYDEVVEMTGHYDKHKAIKAELSELQKMVNGMKPGPKRSELETEIAALEIQIDTVMPNDFTAAVVAFAIGLEGTDIEKLSEEILRDAAIMAEKAHDNPADHIGGRFERYPGDKLIVEDINRRAIYILAMERKFRERAKNGS